jgi:hypothetical protein
MICCADSKAINDPKCMSSITFSVMFFLLIRTYKNVTIQKVNLYITLFVCCLTMGIYYLLLSALEV